jgi:hypothetical protein
VVVGFGAMILAVGIGLAMGRRTMTVDRRSGRLASWWGTGFTFGRREVPTSAFDRVLLSKSVEGGRNSRTVYPVRLDGPGVDEEVTLARPEDVLLARRTAEVLASFLQLPLHDSSTGEDVAREPEHLDESITERAWRTGERTTVPLPPPDLRTRVEDVGSELHLELPGGGLGIMFWAGVTILSAFAVAFLSSILPGILRLDEPLRFVLAVLVSLPVVGALLALGRTTRMRVLVTASRLGLQVEERFPLRRRLVEIPGQELEQLDVVGGAVRIKVTADTPRGASLEAALATQRLPDGRPMPGWALALISALNRSTILARSDTVEVRFGEGLTEAEVHYLHALLRRALTGK